MNTAELERLFQGSARKIVSAEITDGPGPLPHGVFEQAPRVTATLDDGRRVELFSFYAHERSFDPSEFVGLTVEEGRNLSSPRVIRLPSRAAPRRDDRRRNVGARSNALNAISDSARPS